MRRHGPVIALALLLAPLAVPALARQADPNAARPMEWSGEVELGWRSRSVDGSQALWDSHANLDEGARLLGLRVRGLPGGASTGRFMDSFSAEAWGLGGDPQQSFRVFSARRGVYRWEVRGLRQSYVFDVPAFAAGLPPGNLGQHTDNRIDHKLDTSLQLTPGRFTVNLGWSRQELEGPGFTTQDFSRDEFLIAGDLDRRSDDYRAELAFPAGRWRLAFEQLYRDFESTSRFDLADGETTGNNAGNSTTLTSFTREVPLDGSTWVSRASAAATFADRVELALRLVHSEGETDFTSAQRGIGVAFSGTAIDEIIAGTGDSDRPSDLAEAGVTIRTLEWLDVVSLTRWSAYEIEGTTRESVVTNGGAPSVTVDELKTEVNGLDQRTELVFRAGPRWTFRAGHRWYARDVTLTDNGVEESSDQTTTTWSGSASFRPGPRFTGYAEYRDGEIDNLFTRIEPYEFRLARLRGNWSPVASLTISGSVGLRSSENPNPDNRNDVDAWVYALSGTYAGRRWHVSAGGNRVDLSSDTTVFFFSSGARVRGVSEYDLDADAWFAEGGVQIAPRVRTSLHYRRVDASGSFPVDYTSVQPEISVKILESLWASGAWYRYEYEEGNTPSQDYDVDGYVWSLTYTF